MAAESSKKEDILLTIRGDSKLIEDIIGHETVDGLPIFMSERGVD